MQFRSICCWKLVRIIAGGVALALTAAPGASGQTNAGRWSCARGFP